ncbi:hypothetical protein [Nostoc sp. 2RC]|uniref:hypothetical protein n=1 Tax=Nostoc sp. 2RC TaxID=2485484 RepID=UPI001623D434|nr:hypothetical protein [Nostoc sp. 2RC]MBC1235733.1 hypothetical protein [Nostoc sp. 2RC]
MEIDPVTGGIMKEKYLSEKEELECNRTITSIIKCNNQLEYLLWHLKYNVFKNDTKKSIKYGSFAQICTQLYKEKKISLAPTTCYEIAWAYEEKRIIKDVIKIDITGVDISVHARLELRKETDIKIKEKIFRIALSNAARKNNITHKDIKNARFQLEEQLIKTEEMVLIPSNKQTQIGSSKSSQIGEDVGVISCADEVVNNQGVPFYPNKPIYTWQGIRFRSKAEVQIAKALDRVNVSFLANCVVRLTDPRKTGNRRNMEADFVVLYEGKLGILEVDGPSHKPETRAIEQERDRLFQHNGIPIIQRFTHSKCEQHPDDVVEEFLQIIKKVG